MTAITLTNPYQSAYCYYCAENKQISYGTAKPVAHYGFDEPYPQDIDAELECGHKARFVSSLRTIRDRVPQVRFV